MLDEYGKEIEYDINNWHGEDFTIANSNFSNKEKPIENDSTGTLIVSLGKINVENIDIIELSFIDDKYNVKDVYLYKNNGFNEAISLNEGQYEVLSVLDMTTAKSLTTNKTKFTIQENKNEYIKLEYIATNSSVNEEIIEVTSKDKSTSQNNINYIAIIMNFILVLCIIILIIIVLIKRNGEE